MNSLFLRRSWAWLLLLALSLVAGAASAFIGNVPTCVGPPTPACIQGPSPPGPGPGNPDGPSYGYITSSQFGDPTAGNEAASGGCHSCHAANGNTATNVQLTIAGVTQTLGANPPLANPITTNFNVLVGSADNDITLTFDQDATKAKGGFLLFHENADGGMNNQNGRLKPNGAETHECQTTVVPPFPVPSPDTCSTTPNNNSEVMHTVPQPRSNLGGGASRITFRARYDAPAAARCGVFAFRLWINSVNDDQQCFRLAVDGGNDNSEYFRFTITTTCATGGNPCQACNNPAGGVCTAAAASGNVCRAQNGSNCDQQETCNGIATTCPADGKLTGACPSGADGNPCTDDACNGVSDNCQHTNNTANCGNASLGDCDLQDQCSGGACIDRKVGNGVACPTGADANICTNDICNGVSNLCQHPVVANPTAVQCRAAAAGGCDLADFCTAGGLCPDNKSTAQCRASTDAACDPAEFCDGINNGCPANVTLNGVACTADANVCTRDVCITGVCSHPADLGGTACGAATTCTNPSTLQPGGICVNGTPGCTTPAPISCASVCSAGTCSGVCTSDAQCNAGFFCNSANTCQHKNFGDSCPASDCLIAGCRQCDVNGTGNNFCVDGVCCNAACGGGSTTDCQSCNVSVGLRGTCSPQTGTSCSDNSLCTTGETCSAGTCGSPTSTVMCTALNACHVAGTCNPATGTCSNPNAAVGTACGVPVCQDQYSRIPTSACDGSGNCVAGTPVTCFPNQCAAGACVTGCLADGNCGVGAYCDTTVVGGQCKPKQIDGSPCSPGANNSCSSNKCIDGFCCNSDCTGQCEACDVTNLHGVCSPVTGSPHAGKMVCTSDGSACGGACDGANRAGCAYPTAECRAASCDAPSGVATAKADCAGGACPAIITASCAPFVCGPTQCNGNCAIDTDCTTGNFCQLGVCKPKLKKGDKCGGNNQCETAQCVDTYCCDVACGGQCQACDVMGSVGICTTVPSGPPHAPRNGCAGVGVCQGSCNGSSATVCGFPDALTQCSAPTCMNGVSTTESVCNGTGRCSTTDTNPCLPYACGGLKCRTQCATTQECAPGYQCIGVSCVPAALPEAGMVPNDGAVNPDAVVADAATVDGGAPADVSMTETGVPVADASAPGTDAGSGEIDVSKIPNAEYDGSCACRTPGRESPVSSWNALALLGLAAAVVRRRRR